MVRSPAAFLSPVSARVCGSSSPKLPPWFALAVLRISTPLKFESWTPYLHVNKYIYIYIYIYIYTYVHICIYIIFPPHEDFKSHSKSCFLAVTLATWLSWLFTLQDLESVPTQSPLKATVICWRIEHPSTACCDSSLKVGCEPAGFEAVEAGAINNAWV